MSIREYKYYVATVGPNKYHINLLTNNTMADLTSEEHTKHEYKYLFNTQIKEDPKVIIHKDSEEEVPQIITKNMIDFIYFSEFNINECLLLVQHKKYYYLIHDTFNENTKANKKEILISRITIADNFMKIMNELSNKARKTLGILSYIKFKTGKFKYEKHGHIPFNIKSLYPFDLIYENKQEIIDLLNKQIMAENSDILILTNMFIINNEIMEKLNKNEKIKTILICNNINITSFNFLQNFPNIEKLSLWDMPQIKDESVMIIADKLEEIQFHHCSISLLIFKYLNNLNLKKIIINSQKFKCHFNKCEMIINEWNELNYDHLTDLYINSADLTLECINEFIKRFVNLTHLILHNNVLENVKKNVKTGYEKETILFQSATNKENNLLLNRDIKFTGLNKQISMYSDEFIAKMQQLGKFETIENLSKSPNSPKSPETPETPPL
jgi:hypothetical protein